MTTTNRNPQQVDLKHPGQYSGDEMPLVEHLAELRSRLIKCLIGVVLGMVLGFYFVDDIFRALYNLIEAATAGRATIQQIGPTETFTAYIKVSFLAGVALAMPVIVYQLVAFISPGLTRSERGYVLRALPFISILFFAGLAFAYFIVLRSALGFLLTFGLPEIERNLRISDTISFVTNLMIWVGVSFEMPVVVYTLIKLRIVTANQLAAWRRYALILIVVAAAIITPTPDPLNMLLVAVPMYLLFELGIILGRIGTRGSNRV